MPIKNLQTNSILDQSIPISERKSALTMGLLWLTMVASFPAVLAGFEWYRNGITLSQVAFCGVISVFLLLLYSVPACELGARTGLGYCVLGKKIFGRWGGAFLTFNLLALFVAWYALTAVLMAQAVLNLFHCQISLVWLSVIFALLMALNNVFGFTGVTHFASFAAAPILIAWVMFVLWKALHDPVSNSLPALPHPNNMAALSITSSFIIGFAVWGNEQDYWRYSKPGIWRSAIPLLAAIIIGQIIFPLAGWFVARAYTDVDYSSVTTFMSNYCFGGIAILGLLILTADYFSTNDSSLFGCAAAAESVLNLNHSLTVGIFATVASLIAALLSLTDMGQSFSNLISVNCILLPTPTIIMINEWWLQRNIFRQSKFLDYIDDSTPIPAVHIPALIALGLGLLVGLATSGLIPFLEFCHFGIYSLNAWLTAIAIYTPLRIYEHNRSGKILDQHRKLEI